MPRRVYVVPPARAKGRALTREQLVLSFLSDAMAGLITTDGGIQIDRLGGANGPLRLRYNDPNPGPP